MMRRTRTIPVGRTRRSAVRRPGRARRVAFTLLELLVAVGASVLIALALAQLFRTTGDTVTKGRRAAYFNSTASMIQRTLARDFAAMSRNGYMLIRHEVTNGRAAGGPANYPNFVSPSSGGFTQARVPLVRGQAAALHRPRRIDEIMFFAEGSYASVRDPSHPLWIAQSSQARIYYGHGTFSAPIPQSANFYYDKPGVFANPNVLGGTLGQAGGLNAFASDWVLMRHATLLAPPQTAASDFPTSHLPTAAERSVWGVDPGVPGSTSNALARLRDKNRLIAGQPASPSIFRTFNRQPSPSDVTAYPQIGGWQRPGLILFNSGLIDVATTDLAEIRSYVMQTHDGVTPIPEPIFPNISGGFSVIGVISPVPQPDTPRLPQAFADGEVSDADQAALIFNMHAWMRDGMPTNSHGDPFVTAAGAAQTARVRMRIADFAENLPAILTDSALGAPAQRFKRSDLIANERMLTASNLVPHCTEFVVEWSFGEADPFTGDLRWYGSSVPQDDNADGQIDRIGYTYYDYDFTDDPPVARVFVDRSTGELSTDNQQHPVDPRLIYGVTYDDAQASGDPRPMVAHFGFVDPTYVPPGTSQLQSLPWAWPRLVRVTITLTDPSDTSIERSFQFMFDVPQDGR